MGYRLHYYPHPSHSGRYSYLRKDEVFKNKAWHLGAEYNRQFLISVLYALFLTGLISSRGLKGI